MACTGPGAAAVCILGRKWIGPPGACLDAGEGTDFYATAHGEVSITPLQIDLTHKTQLESLARGLA